MNTDLPNYNCKPDSDRATEPLSEVGSASFLLSAFGLGPRQCEDCGEVFTVPPYMDCAKWKHCTSCSGKRFHEWIKTPEAKKALEMFEARNFTDNA